MTRVNFEVGGKSLGSTGCLVFLTCFSRLTLQRSRSVVAPCDALNTCTVPARRQTELDASNFCHREAPALVTGTNGGYS